MPAASEALGQPRTVVVGAGFAGIEVARALGKAGLLVTIIDRQNHHLFQPLLYQVATAALSPADIAEPVRKMLGRYAGVEVVLRCARRMTWKGHHPQGQRTLTY